MKIILSILLVLLILLIFNFGSRFDKSIHSKDQVKECGYFLGIQTVSPIYFSKNINDKHYLVFKLESGEMRKFIYIPKIHQSILLNIKNGSYVCYYYSLKYKDDYNNDIISKIQ